MDNVNKIVENLINLVGSAAGIILFSIGSVMILQTVFEYMLGIDSDYYDTVYRCDVYDVKQIKAMKISGFIPNNAQQNKTYKEIEITPEKEEQLNKLYKECVEEEKENKKQRYALKQKKDLTVGLSFFLVSIPLIYFYQRKRLFNKK